MNIYLFLPDIHWFYINIAMPLQLPIHFLPQLEWVIYLFLYMVVYKTEIDIHVEHYIAFLWGR